MIRPLALTFGVALSLTAAPFCTAGENFPEDHHEPITLRVLASKDGHPLPHIRLTLFAGYDKRDLHDRQWRQEILTDDQGKAQLSYAFANFPFVQVWSNKSLCFGKSKKVDFSIELIRRDGLSTPNRCGRAMVADAPGIFNVYAKAKAAKAPKPSTPRKPWLNYRWPLCGAILHPSLSSQAPPLPPASEQPIQPTDQRPSPPDATPAAPKAIPVAPSSNAVPAAPVAPSPPLKAAPAPAAPPTATPPPTTRPAPVPPIQFHPNPANSLALAGDCILPESSAR